MKRALITPFLALPLVLLSLAGCGAPGCSDSDVLALVQHIIDENLTNNWNYKSTSKHAESPALLLTVSVEQITTVERKDKRVSCKAILVVHDGSISEAKQQLIYIVNINADGKLYGTVHITD
jgi:hypothetical protein